MSLTDFGSYLGGLVPILLIITAFIRYIHNKYTSESKTIADLLDVHIDAYLRGRDKSFARRLLGIYMYIVIIMLISYIIIFLIKVFTPKLLQFGMRQIFFPIIAIIVLIVAIWIINKIIYGREKLKYRLVYKDNYTNKSFIIIKIIRNKMLVLSVNYRVKSSDIFGINRYIEKSNIENNKIVSSYGNAYVRDVISLNYHSIKYVKNSLLESMYTKNR